MIFSIKKYLDLTYPELVKTCQEVNIEITKEQITQVERDTITQAKGNNFFKHRAGRIGASQCKAASGSNPALPSQSLIQSVCYPEFNKVNTKAVLHGCKHEEHAIKAYEEKMKATHTNFKIVRCGLFINEEHPWLHATPDFLCCCDCCGEGCGEVKCPFCIENCDFDSYVLKASSCLEKDSSRNFHLKTKHQYYYQVQQQIFTITKRYCDFVVCAFRDNGETELVAQRIGPDTDHWKAVLPKVTLFWRTCVLHEVLGRWYTRKHNFSNINPPETHDNVCFCRTVTDEGTVIQEAHGLLAKINPQISGFQRPTLGPIRQFDVMTGEFVQIVHINNNHWVCLSSIGCLPGHANLLDSLAHAVISQESRELAMNLLGPNFKGIANIPVQQQHNQSDCGIFAIAFATCLVYGSNPCNVTFNIPRMRPHLLWCIQAGSMQLFPTT